MNRSLTRLRLIFVALFVLGVVGVGVYQIYWAGPQKECEGRGDWWDPATRICGDVIYIPNITGRQPGESREAASRRAAAEKLSEEARARGE
ncbi:hypothetical protein Q0812_11500 [Brevundimonas sp. 2R-24]|uniref:Uncharacterized protein n=1 Tax=Peiella sedimenti TaxID=3061083 RepID=A0ABT8SN97_9CAUL|nr:hypothetical protein [Caulobacteraceae bacterium XZ-24]